MVLLDRYYIKNWNDIEVDLRFKTGLTVIRGDSGVGKSVIYNLVSNDALSGDVFKFKVIFIDWRSINNINLSQLLSETKGALIIIDNGDIILDEKIKKYISTDVNNQYIIMAHSVMGYVFSSKNNSAKLVLKDGRLELKY